MTNKGTETVLVRINKGFGSHTLMEHMTDEAGEEIQRGVIYRNTDEKAFELPLSAYNEFPTKYGLCDHITGEISTPVVQTTQSMQAKVEAAKNKTNRKIAK